ncbi:dTDP-glucose 4,6-dehydratase [Methanothermococcus okinawensis]|uniref:dTDP-glucose 4,6-dehydratase n=1 Tax=Methanothermococcus okinawensis (strain DSM 14208 / JCM 11175 / IH1) TaxID=647113 RepID=F8AK61_METOI|nr:dTDP-glucose 4,6-dehydratase [Methanothermococcus okinawensis]AEH07428.1 dTDP-glucose 4,6-dehydratase [Methanothermococcus okinawensis IH1]
MKMLVTGGAGFIGSNFIRYMLDKYKDLEIINLDKLGYGSNLENLKDITNKYNSRYSFVKGDINDFELVSKLIKEVDAVVNMAAETHVDRSISNPYSFLESNIMGVYTILEAVKKYNPDVNLVHVSTDEVYGDIEEGSFTENDRLMPSSPYSAGKAGGDMLVLGYARTYNLNAKITRCTNNYGPYQFPEKLIPKTIIRASKDLKIPIYGKGDNIRDWLYVLDHCSGIETVLEKGEKREVYNISSNNEKMNIDIAKMILELLNKPLDLIEFVEDRPGHDVRYSLDSSKLKELGWKPKYDFKEGLKETVNWYMDNEWWWKPLINEKVLSPTPWKLKW